jgi:hypothetical protein
VIGVTESTVGAVHDSEAWVFPATAVRLVGAGGANKLHRVSRASMDASVSLVVSVPAALLAGTTLVETAVPAVSSEIFLLGMKKLLFSDERVAGFGGQVIAVFQEK